MLIIKKEKEGERIMKILCILYDDPKGGMPTSYPLKALPKLEKYPDGMTLPTPKAIDFNPGELLGCVSGELGLRKFLKERIKIHE
jgi:formate dehydrogenase